MDLRSRMVPGQQGVLLHCASHRSCSVDNRAACYGTPVLASHCFGLETASGKAGPQIRTPPGLFVKSAEADAWALTWDQTAYSISNPHPPVVAPGGSATNKQGLIYGPPAST